MRRPQTHARQISVLCMAPTMCTATLKDSSATLNGLLSGGPEPVESKENLRNDRSTGRLGERCSHDAVKFSRTPYSTGARTSRSFPSSVNEQVFTTNYSGLLMWFSINRVAPRARHALWMACEGVGGDLDCRWHGAVVRGQGRLLPKIAQRGRTRNVMETPTAGLLTSKNVCTNGQCKTIA
jgi:hypothetical protein